MRQLPAVVRDEDSAALVVRTDYSDAQAWQVVRAELTQPWGSLAQEADVQFVDDPAWGNATVDEVLAVVGADEYLGVVFLADRVTLQGEPHALLAVTTLTPDDCPGEEDYAALIEFGSSFRIVPAEVHGLHIDLSLLGNMGFEEYAEAAHQDSDGIFRGLV